MKQKSIDLVLLFDFYGKMLTEKQREFFDLYYNEDLSLSEIAENEGITRQGVRDSIVRAENLLMEFEGKLGLFQRYGKIDTGLSDLLNDAVELRQINQRNFLSNAIEEITDRMIERIHSITEHSADEYIQERPVEELRWLLKD